MYVANFMNIFQILASGTIKKIWTVSDLEICLKCPISAKKKSLAVFHHITKLVFWKIRKDGESYPILLYRMNNWEEVVV
jgi:hypothetical protein